MVDNEYQELRDLVINAAIAIRHMAVTVTDLSAKIDHRCKELEHAIKNLEGIKYLDAQGKPESIRGDGSQTPDLRS
jgi:hypothetical protein